MPCAFGTQLDSRSSLLCPAWNCYHSRSPRVGNQTQSGPKSPSPIRDAVSRHKVPDAPMDSQVLDAVSNSYDEGRTYTVSTVSQCDRRGHRRTRRRRAKRRTAGVVATPPTPNADPASLPRSQTLSAPMLHGMRSLPRPNPLLSPQTSQYAQLPRARPASALAPRPRRQVEMPSPVCPEEPPNAVEAM